MDLQLLLIIFAGFTIITVGGMFVLAGSDGQKHVHLKAQKIIQQRLNRHNPTAAATDLSLKKKDLDAKLGVALKALPSLTRLRERLDRTGKDISIRQYYTWVLGIFFGGIIVFKLLFGSSLLVAILM